MISEKMIQSLNNQIALEGYASFLYLSMACWCEEQGLAGCAAFMRRQSGEEREHKLRIISYLHEVGAKAIVPGIPQPPASFESIRALFEQVYAHEQKVTRSIYDLINQATGEQDHATLHFLQWYVAEQREEENLMRSLMDRIRLIGDGPMSLYYIDKEVEKMNNAQEAEEAKEQSS
ncbi:MAG: ferritin [Saprospiraceae bacterium]